MSPRGCQLRSEPGMESADVGLRVESPRHPRLVGDDEHKKPGIVGQFHRRLRPLDPTETIARADVTVIMVQHPVAVEKDRRTALLPRHFVPRPGQRVGYPDIDKIAIEPYPQEASVCGECRQHMRLER